MHRLRVIRKIDGHAVTYVREGHARDDLVTVERNGPGEVLALLWVNPPGVGIDIRAAADRQLVELPDGRSANLFAVPRNGANDERCKVTLPSGAIVNVRCGDLRAVEPVL